MRLTAVLLLVLSLPAFSLAAEPAAAIPGAAETALTLDEALLHAREVSALLDSLDAEVAAAEAGIREARGARLPEVSLSAGYVRRSNIPEFSLTLPDGSTRTVFPNIPDNWNSRVGFSVPLYTGGRVAGLEAAARSERQAAGNDRTAGETDLALEVTVAYWSLVTADEEARVLADSLAAYEAHLVDARNRQNVGLAASNEVLAVEVERDRAELARIRARNDAELASAHLARLLDLPAGGRVVAVDPLEAPPRPSPEVEALVAEALQARPERNALAARLAAAESRTTVERSASKPQVALAGGWDYANPNRNILPPEAVWDDSWDVGVAVSFRLFDGGRTAAAAARAAASALALRRRLDDLDRAIRLDVTSRALDVRTAQAAIGVSERALASARENLRVSQDRYREGVIPSSELLDAEVALLRAGLDRARALAGLRIALAGLDRAVGR